MINIINIELFIYIIDIIVIVLLSLCKDVELVFTVNILKIR